MKTIDDIKRKREGRRSLQEPMALPKAVAPSPLQYSRQGGVARDISMSFVQCSLKHTSLPHNFIKFPNLEVELVPAPAQQSS